MPRLILKTKEAKEKSFLLSKPTTIIGRRLSNDITLSDPFVSRVHAEIKALEDGGYEIHDVGAKYPIRVNDKIISVHLLKDGDEIRLGDSLLTFRSEEGGITTQVEFLAPENLPFKPVELAALDTRKTVPYLREDFDAKDLASLQKDHQRLMLLCEFSKAVNSYLKDPRQLLEEILNTALRTLDAERGFIALLDEESGELVCEVVRDLSGEGGTGRLEVSKTITHKALKDSVSILTMNALEDSQLGQAKSVWEYKIRSAMCVPLFFQERVLGIVYLDNRASEASFSEDDLMFLMAMCYQAGIALGNAQLHRQVVQENICLEKELKGQSQLLGDSEEMKKIHSTIKKVAPSDVTVLLQGETGTGKELVAKAIHALSPRRDKAFIPVNCAAIPKELIESELFGHEKGAFTGAISRRDGKFQMANGGTIFLDEVADMSLDTQAKVLRVLEEKEFERVGGAERIKVDVRVIAATNKDLAKAVEEGRLREDLYYRLNVVPLQLPPLRQRKQDIIPLAEHFAAVRVKKISSRARELLMSYSWPGNVRELKNCIERAVVLGDGETIQPEDLPYYIRRGGKIIPPPLESIGHIEEDHIIRVLRHTGWNKSEAVRMLGITRQTLDNKIKKYKIRKS